MTDTSHTPSICSTVITVILDQLYRVYPRQPTVSEDMGYYKKPRSFTFNLRSNPFNVDFSVRFRAFRLHFRGH